MHITKSGAERKPEAYNVPSPDNISNCNNSWQISVQMVELPVLCIIVFRNIKCVHLVQNKHIINEKKELWNKRRG